MQASNHSVILKTVYFQPHRIIIDPGSRGGGDQTAYYLLTDSMGSCMGLMDSSGTIVSSYQWGPFGERISNSAPTIYNPVSYAGLCWDSETELYFASSRYYDPTTARFTTKDSYRGEMESPISQNRYIYCLNNPATLADPSGFAPIEGEHAFDSSPTTVKSPKREFMPKFADTSSSGSGDGAGKGGGPGDKGGGDSTSFYLGLGSKYAYKSNDHKNAVLKSICGALDFAKANFGDFSRITEGKGTWSDMVQHSTIGQAIKNYSILYPGANPVDPSMIVRWCWVTGELLTKDDMAMMAGFWASYDNTILGLGLPIFPLTMMKNWDTPLTVVDVAMYSLAIWCMESHGGSENGDSWVMKKAKEIIGELDQVENCAQNVQRANLEEMNEKLGLNFETWYAVNTFEGLGMGTTWLMCALNTVRSAWVNINNKPTMQDLACAGYLYNPNYEFSYHHFIHNGIGQKASRVDIAFGQFWRIAMQLAFRSTVNKHNWTGKAIWEDDNPSHTPKGRYSYRPKGVIIP